MREIKFRAWDGKKMYYDPILHDGLMFETGRDFDDWTPCDHKLMQYTGLKDKNGIEIYEGDIVRIECEITFSSDSKYEIKWSNGGFYAVSDGKFCGEPSQIWDSLAPQGDRKPSEMSIIGNIYEIM